MATKESLIEELHFLTEKISTSFWTLNLGALGITWSLFIASNVQDSVRFTARNAIWVCGPCLIAIMFEMAQYISGYRLAQRLCEDMERQVKRNFSIRPTTFCTDFAKACFGGKSERRPLPPSSYCIPLSGRSSEGSAGECQTKKRGQTRGPIGARRAKKK